MKSFSRARRLAVLALASVAVVGLAACGDDSSNTGTDSEAGASKDKAVKVGTAYVGATAGKADASQTPITIGWINQDQSVAGSAPENTYALKAAISFVNDELGGIDGHPIKLEQCTIGASEQQGKQCAQKFLNDPNVKAVMNGLSIIGGPSFMATMAPDGTSKKPFLSFAPISPADGSLKNVYYTNGGFLAVDAIPVFFRDFFKAKSVSQIWSDAPALTPFIPVIVDGFKKRGITSKIGRIPVAGTDVVGPMVAGGIKTEDSIMLNPDDTSQCIAMAKGMTQLGVTDKPTLGYAACLVPAAKKALGDFPKWMYFRDTLSPDIADPTGQVDTFKYALQTYQAADGQATLQSPNGANSFGLVMLLTKWANATGADDITNAAIAEQAKAQTGPIFLGYPTPKFGTQPFPAIAANAMRFYNYEGDGKWTDATSGKWITPQG